jgi:hypothetical protein
MTLVFGSPLADRNVVSSFGPSSIGASHPVAAPAADGRVGNVTTFDYDEATFCPSCARPVCDGAVIYAGEACCSVECALEMREALSEPLQ